MLRTTLLAVFVAIFLTGCVAKASLCLSCEGIDGVQSTSINSEDKMYFEEVMRIPADCSACKGRGDGLFINGVKYKSDVAINCCLEKNMIDTNVGLKKVYFHRIVDARSSARSIYYTGIEGNTAVFNSNPRLEVLFYMFLQRELNSRGIVVVDTQTSPYTYRLDFRFDELRGSYSGSSEILNGHLKGLLILSNINFKKTLPISTRHHVEKLEASESGQFDFFIALLVKQAAIKVADEITKL